MPTRSSANISASYALAAAALVTELAGAAEPIEFKGIPFGAPEARILEAFPGVRCAAMKQIGDRLCSVAKNTYAGVPATLYFTLKGGAVIAASARYRNEDFRHVVDAVTSRYGAPEAPVSGRPGELRWTIGRVLILALPNSGSEGPATISFIPFEVMRDFAKEQEADKKMRARDL